MTAYPFICSALLRAAVYAAEKHRNGPHRKGVDAAPYINHPLAVANLLATEVGVQDIEVLQAALLHDVVEDTPTQLSELEELFGARVAGLVDEVSDNKSLTSAERKRLQIADAPSKSLGAALLKAADKTCNLREIVSSPPPWSLERKLAYFEHAAQVVQRLPHLPEAMRNVFGKAYAMRATLEAAELRCETDVPSSPAK